MKNNSGSRFERGNGILLHITSLPGEYGIGNLGRSAFDFVDYLKSSGQKYWQILPIGPVTAGYSYSPYSSYSSFAGNQLLIDPVSLQQEPWMRSDILSNLKRSEERDKVDFLSTELEIDRITRTAWKDFTENRSESDLDKYIKFQEENKHWLDDFALFRSLSQKFGSFNWRSWDEGIKIRKDDDIKRYRIILSSEIGFIKFEQFVFDLQWKNLKNHCRENNIQLIGDIPIYAGMDSGDVWSNTSIFQFSDDFSPEGVAGVPPDYFSENGQKWGNPLYRWFSEENIYSKTLEWWSSRIKRLMTLVDIVRIDHFRGFESYWSIPYGSDDGKIGKWETGPGDLFFNYLNEKTGDIRIIAEDLGIITAQVKALRERTGFPGMKILQFAFDRQPDNPYIPENITDPNCIIYTGTHDNNTSLGWFTSEVTDISVKEYIRSYLKIGNDEQFLWKFIECAISSIADICILPLQDVLGYGEEARFNTPGTSGESNWRWKTINSSFQEVKITKLKLLCEKYGRI